MTTILRAPAVRRFHRRYNRQQVGVVVFDGDDTLWETERLYDKARAAAAKIVAEAGVDPTLWEDLQRIADLANVELLGLSAHRFPTSCAEAYFQACEKLGMPPDEVIAGRVRIAASQVFEWRAGPVPGAKATLERLSRERPLILFTQGDVVVQRKRLADSGFKRFFDRIEIVDRKTPSALNELLRTFGADPSCSWFIGNSIPSDVNPALAAGMRAVWIDAHVWPHERREILVDTDGRCVVANELSDVPAVVLSAA